MSANGVLVPNNGYIENLYFNTNLANTDVVSILEQLTYDDDGYHLLLYGTSGTVEVFKNETTGYLIRSYVNEIETKIFVSKKGNEPFEGWNPEYLNPLAYNGTAVTANVLGKNAGAENDKVVSLFSINDFVESEEPVVENEEYSAGMFSMLKSSTLAGERLAALLFNIAEAIREVEGSTDKISPLDFPERIRALSSGSVDNYIAEWLGGES